MGPPGQTGYAGKMASSKIPKLAGTQNNFFFSFVNIFMEISSCDAQYSLFINGFSTQKTG